MTKQFYKALDQLARDGHRNLYFEAALDVIAKDTDMHVVDVTDIPCIEIDFPEDYAKAKGQILERLRARR